MLINPVEYGLWNFKINFILKARRPLNCQSGSKKAHQATAILTYLTVHSFVDDGTKSIRAITPPPQTTPSRFKPLLSRRKQPPPLKTSWAELLLLFGFCGVVARTKRLGICLAKLTVTYLNSFFYLYCLFLNTLCVLN